jgi:hypothetical protein
VDTAFVLVTDDHNHIRPNLKVGLDRLRPAVRSFGGTGIACWRAQNCLAIGNGVDTHGRFRGVGLIVRGRRDAAFLAGGSLEAVECTHTASCTMVGGGVGKTSDTIFFFGHPGRMRMYHPAQTISGLINVISCSRGGSCIAGGYMALTSGVDSLAPSLVATFRGHPLPIH